VGFRVFKTTYKDRKGRRKEAAAWYVEFRDQLDIVRRLPAFTSKAASEEMGRNLVKLVAYHKASGGQTDPALTRFLTGLPAKLREKLVSIGLLAADRVATAKPLSEHLDDFALALTAKGNSPFHVETVTGRARRVLVDGCGYRFYGDISASRVMQHLHTLRAYTTGRQRHETRHQRPDVQFLPGGGQAILPLDVEGPASGRIPCCAPERPEREDGSQARSASVHGSGAGGPARHHGRRI
jgi:hypothetical protein